MEKEVSPQKGTKEQFIKAYTAYVNDPKKYQSGCVTIFSNKSKAASMRGLLEHTGETIESLLQKAESEAANVTTVETKPKLSNEEILFNIFLKIEMSKNKNLKGALAQYLKDHESVQEKYDATSKATLNQFKW